MNQQKYKWILYIISITIVMTIASQLYWNYNNYKINKQQFINDVQISLDNAVSIYHAELAKTNFITFIEKDNISNISLSVTKSINDSIEKYIQKHITQFKNDTSKAKGFAKIISDKQTAITYFEGKGFSEMSFLKGKRGLNSIKSLKDSLQIMSDISTIYVSLQRDSLDIKKINILLEKELNRKEINIPYYLKHYVNNKVFSAQTPKENIDFFSTFANSTFLKEGEKLELLFTDKSKLILKRGLSGILLSLILAIVIISSLFYLLNIIKKQKNLAAIKNDLISNITHEFKTPITTASAALEALKHFDALKDVAKTKNYVTISSNQLEKLNVMVEKLLETATLDSEKLILQKERTDLNVLINNITEKAQEVNKSKQIYFVSKLDTLVVNLDSFHFENAINNLIDNAVKYGGDTITVLLEINETIEISVIDDGKGINKNEQAKIFDKFYRIPRGNTHDVKGFGIGLYYTKKIIEKHAGKIRVISKNNQTVFKIQLPI